MGLPLFFRYYYDVNKTNFVITFILVSLFRNPTIFLLSFSGFGFVISFITYDYFHKIEYYFYANGGYSKRKLIYNTIIVNLIISIVIFFLFK